MTPGSTTVICSDKTGTLTENQLTVQRVHAGGQWFEFTGGGYEAQGEIRRDGQPVSAAGHPALLECLQAGLLCNDSQLVRKEGRVAVQGDPTEAALIAAARKQACSRAGPAPGIRASTLSPSSPSTNTWPPDSESTFDPRKRP